MSLKKLYEALCSDIKETNLNNCHSCVLQKETYSRHFPLEIQVEVSNECNLHCIMCPYHFSIDGSKKFIDLSILQKLKPVYPYIIKAFLMGAGEPLLHPRFIDIVKMMKSYNIHITFSTNGMLLDSSLAREFVALGVDYVTFSLDGATAATYNSIRRGADFETVIENVTELSRLRDLKKRTKPAIWFAPVMMKNNVHETVEFIHLAKRLGIQGVHFESLFMVDDGSPYSRFYKKFCLANVPEKELHAYFKDVPKTAEELNIMVTSRCFDVSALKASPESCPAKPSINKLLPCEYPWTSIYINWDGGVRTCCGGAPILGHLVDSPFEKIWNGETYINFRKQFVNGKISGSCVVCLENNFPQPIIEHNRSVLLSRKICRKIWTRLIQKSTRRILSSIPRALWERFMLLWKKKR